jgi:hypothetical protein
MARGVRYPSVWMIIDLPSKGHPIDRVVFDPLERALEEITKKATNRLKPTHDFWSPENRRVDWRYKTTRHRDRVERLMDTVSTPYLWVTGGTTRRHAYFPPGYRAKTAPGVKGKVGPGGPPLGVSKSARRGIDARNFEDIIIREFSPSIGKIVMKHVTGGLLGRFWGPQKHVRARIL